MVVNGNNPLRKLGERGYVGALNDLNQLAVQRAGRTDCVVVEERRADREGRSPRASVEIRVAIYTCGGEH